MCLIKPASWLGMEENGDGDWFCDPQNNREECGYDGGDCCEVWGYDNGADSEPTSEWHWDLRCSGTLDDNTKFWWNPVETPRSPVSTLNFIWLMIHIDFEKNVVQLKMCNAYFF